MATKKGKTNLILIWIGHEVIFVDYLKIIVAYDFIASNDNNLLFEEEKKVLFYFLLYKKDLLSFLFEIF